METIPEPTRTEVPWTKVPIGRDAPLLRPARRPFDRARATRTTGAVIACLLGAACCVAVIAAVLYGLAYVFFLAVGYFVAVGFQSGYS